jgi:hypothetical protein
MELLKWGGNVIGFLYGVSVGGNYFCCQGLRGGGEE